MAYKKCHFNLKMLSTEATVKSTNHFKYEKFTAEICSFFLNQVDTNIFNIVIFFVSFMCNLFIEIENAIYNVNCSQYLDNPNVFAVSIRTSFI